MDQITAADSLTARYEALRSFGLGEPTVPAERAGLTAFLLRGMWGWAGAISDSSSHPPFSLSAPIGSRSRDERDSLVPLLATIAINFKEEAIQ